MYDSIHVVIPGAGVNINLTAGLCTLKRRRQGQTGGDSSITTGTARNSGTSVSKITNRTGQPSFRPRAGFEELGNFQGEFVPSDVDLQHRTGKDRTGNGLMDRLQ